LTQAERHQLLEEWSQPVLSAPSPSEELYHEAFAAQAAKTPEAVAIVFEERQLTYRQVDVQSNQLAHFLRRRGVGPDVLVGICLERSPELVVGLLAILKAGGAFVPLEPSYPAAQLSGLLSETRPAVLITDSHLAARLEPRETVTVCLDAERDPVAAESPAAPEVRVTGANLAMVTFSSGSTGKPKAIPRCHPTHGPGAWKRAPFQLCESDRHVLKSSLDSTLLLREVFWPLLTGARMIIAGPSEDRDTAALLRLLINHQITIMTLIPSLLRQLVAEEGLEAWTALRHVTCFGEPLPADVEARFCQRLPAELSISYGTTEAPTLAFRQCRGADPRPLGNLGYRFGNSQIYILDERRQPVPIGVPGELVAGGPGLAIGYLNRREQTDERFIPHPFSRDPGARLYRTGDRARWRSDGSLEFLGRLDEQIKIRGYRIEPAEVEPVLLRHPGVREAVVVARPNSEGENQLVAYLVARSHGLTVSELRAHLAHSLPAHMIPSIYVGLERLPRRPNGKVDRRALPTHEINRLESGQPFVAPRNVIEETLARIWCVVMGLERVGIHDNFFDLGGHSLLALRLFARVEEQFHKRLPLALLFQHGTVAGIARHLSVEADNARGITVVVLQPGAAGRRRAPPVPSPSASPSAPMLELPPQDNSAR
jgi:amino acid adenylation domain-containing protein